MNSERPKGEANHDYDQNHRDFFKNPRDCNRFGAVAKKAASTKRNVKPATSKIRSTAHTAICEEKGKRSRLAMR